MFAIFITALGLLIFRPNFFLFIISILSFYAAFTGERVLHRKRPDQRQYTTWLDRTAALIALAAGSGFIIWGGLLLTGLVRIGWPPAFAFIGIAFGFFLANDAVSDIRSFRTNSTDRNWWWYYHMNRMLGSYIAAVTAFAVQNISRLLPPEIMWLPWVLPAAIGTPLIARWINHYRKQFDRRRSPASLETLSAD